MEVANTARTARRLGAGVGLGIGLGAATLFIDILSIDLRRVDRAETWIAIFIPTIAGLVGAWAGPRSDAAKPTQWPLVMAIAKAEPLPRVE